MRSLHPFQLVLLSVCYFSSVAAPEPAWAGEGALNMSDVVGVIELVFQIIILIVEFVLGKV